MVESYVHRYHIFTGICKHFPISHQAAFSHIAEARMGKEEGEKGSEGSKRTKCQVSTCSKVLN